MAQTIAVTNANVQFSPYNWYSDGVGALAANNINGSSTYALSINAGAYVKFGVTTSGAGNTISVILDTTSLQTLTANQCPYIATMRDSEPVTRTQLSYSASDVTIDIATGLGASTYYFMLVLDSMTYDADTSRWPDPPLSCVKIKSVQIPDTASMAAPPVKSRNVIFYGDSLGEGAGTIGADTTAANSSAMAGWAWFCGNALDAEFGICNFGGQGYAKGLDNATASSTKPTLRSATDANQSWNKYYAGKSRLVSSALSPVPTAVFIESGHNDSSLASSSVTNAINDIRAACATTTWIFCTNNPVGTNGNASAISTGVANATSTGRTKYLAFTGELLSTTALFTPSATSAGRFSLEDNSAHINQQGAAIFAGTIARLASEYIGVAGTGRWWAS